MEIIKFKRGDTFVIECEVAVDMTGWGIRSQVRNGDLLVGDLTVSSLTTTPEKSTFKLICNDTVGWSLGKLNCDIEYTTLEGQIISTDTFYVECIKDSTI